MKGVIADLSINDERSLFFPPSLKCCFVEKLPFFFVLDFTNNKSQ